MNPSVALKREVAGSAEIRGLNQADIRGNIGQGQGAFPWTDVPSYKPEFIEKVKDLDARQSKTDLVFSVESLDSRA